MSAFAISFLFGALFTGKYLLQKVDRLTCCYYGAYCILVNLSGLGTLIFLKDEKAIICLALFF